MEQNSELGIYPYTYKQQIFETSAKIITEQRILCHDTDKFKYIYTLILCLPYRIYIIYLKIILSTALITDLKVKCKIK